MSVELEDMKVITTMAQQAELRFKVSDDEGISGEGYVTIVYETIGRLREIERLAHNYIESLIAEEV